MSEVQTAPLLRTVAILGGNIPLGIAGATDRAGWLVEELHRQFDPVPPLHFSVEDGSARIESNPRPAFKLSNCPKGEFDAREVDRGFSILGESTSPNSDDLLSEHLMVLYDKKGEPANAFVFSLLTMMNNEPFVVMPVREAIGEFGGHVPPWITDGDIQAYLRHVHAGGRFKPMDFPFEIGVAVHKLYRDYPNEHEAMDAFLSKTKGTGIYGLAHTQTSEDLQSLLRLGRDEKHSDELLKVLKGMETVHTNVEGLHMDTPFHRSVAKHMEAIFQEAFRGVLMEWEAPEFSWETASQSFDAFEDIIAHIYNVPVRKLLPNIHIQEEKEPSLRLLMPIIEALWLEQAQNHKPDEFQKMARVFYGALGGHLDVIASETTGDTDLEIERFGAIIGELARRIGTPYTLVDAGSGSGKRILRPVIECCAQQNLAPLSVIGVDLLSFPPPEDGLWTPVVADFSSPKIVPMIQEIDPDATHRIVMCSWSAPADVKTLDREAAFANFSKIAEWVVIDMPSPDNYQPDQIEPSGIGGGGTVERAFPGSDGQGDVMKSFNLPGMTELVVQARLAGLEWVNPTGEEFTGISTKYETKNGYKRFTLVFRKVGEPEHSVARTMFGSFDAGPRRPAQRRS